MNKNKKLFAILTIFALSVVSCSPVSYSPSSDTSNDDSDYHTIVWLNHDMTLLEKDTQVKDGEIPVYHGQDPTKEGTVQYTYTFTGWSPTVVPAYIDATYVAQFEEKLAEYTITWKNYDGTILKTEKYSYDETPYYTGDIPTKPSDNDYDYSWNNWDKEIEKVKSDAVYTAVFKPIEKAIVSLKAQDGRKIRVIPRDFYESNKDKPNASEIFFDRMFDVLIDALLEDTSSPFKASEYNLDAHTLNGIDTKVQNAINEIKSAARTNAISNGTSYETEIHNILAQYNVETLEEYRELKKKQLTKEAFVDNYVSNNQQEVVSNYIKGNKAFPYVTRHILVRVDDLGFIKARINSGQAYILKDIVSRFANSYESNFGALAQTHSGDASNANNGDVGIMDTYYDFINEYQLGIYVYDLLFSQRTNETIQTAKNGLRIPDAAISNFNKNTITYVPASIFEMIYNYDSDTYVNSYVKSHQEYLSTGIESIDFHPRNVLFNKYINKHNVFLISNDIPASYYDRTPSVCDDPQAMDFSRTTYATYDEPEEGMTGMRYIEKLCRNAKQRILTDENGSPILGVRSEYGVHFISISESAFDNDLEQYYTLNSDIYLRNTDTFIGRFSSTFNELSKQKETLLNYAKNFDKKLPYKVFKKMLDIDKSYEFECRDANLDLDEMIENLFNNKAQSFDNEINSKLDNRWSDYLAMLENQRDQRETNNNMVSENQMYDFLDNIYEINNAYPEHN